MKSIKIYIVFFCILIFFILSPQKQVQAAVDCPAATDNKIYVNPTNNLCYSATDPTSNTGFNTIGGTPNAACQVLCPGGTGALPQGHECIVQMNGQCFAGTGPSGFNTPGCTAASQTAITCPSPMDLTTLVVDAQGNKIANVAINITYADAPPAAGGGQTVTSYTNTQGMVTTGGLLYSGDHFIITPNLPGYTFSPTQIGSNANLGDQEMNTSFSCGQTISNPCKFTATAGQNAAATPGAPGTQTAAGAPLSTTTQQTDNTVSNEMNATEKAAEVVAGIVFVAVFIQELLGLGKGKKKREI